MRLLPVLALAALPFSTVADEPLRPVTGFEAERYLGLWREVASIPTWFQSGCAAETTAEYSLAPEPGLIVVANRCTDEDGERDGVDGRARFTGPRDVAALEVTFLSLLGNWVWLISGDYVVIGLDPDYRWAAVAHPSRDYAWLLARETPMAAADVRAALEAYRAAGYDPCVLLTSPAPGEARRPLCEAYP